jgi:predicted RNase H-like HicB family nuclease
MRNTYTFPALFDYADDGISISFPDLPECLSCSETTEEALKDAEEVLGLCLYNREDDNEPIPEPTPLDKVQCEPNQKTVLIKAWMPLVRNEMETASIKKTLTIPAWLNKLAEDKQVNYSHVLQAALKDYLGVGERT